VIQTLDHLYSDPFEGYDQCMLGDSTVSSGNRSLDESTEPTDSVEETESIDDSEDSENETTNDEVKIEFKCKGYRCDLPCS